MADSRAAILRYYAYRATTAYGFYLPVGLLYLQQEYGWAVVGLTQGVFAFALVAAEIPTGYVGDRIGRRASLAAGNVISAGALGVFVFLDSPLQYTVLYAVWAVGWAFRSGTGQAWLYELLDAHDEAGDYARVSGRSSTVLLLTSAVTAAAAGFLVSYGWSVPLVANAALSAVGIPLVLSLPAVGDAAAAGDAHSNGDASDEKAGTGDADVFTVRAAIRTLRLQVARPEIRWLVAYVALFHVLFAVTRPYESPIAKEVGVPVAAIGAMYAGFKLVSAGAASTAGWLQETVGTRRSFAMLVPVYGLAYASIALVPVLVVPVFFLNRGLKTVVGPLRDQYLNDRLEDVGRATVLSGASMALSLASGAATTASGWLVELLGPLQFLAAAGAVVSGAAGILWLAVSPVRTREDAASDVPATAVDAD
jgi:MFS family permease